MHGVDSGERAMKMEGAEVPPFPRQHELGLANRSLAAGLVMLEQPLQGTKALNCLLSSLSTTVSEVAGVALSPASLTPGAVFLVES